MPSYLSYKRQMAVLDADDNEIESWITVRGNHIPIKKGQSKEDAVKSFIKSKGGNIEKGSNQKSELGLIYHKDKGHVKEGRPPKGWTKVEGALTAPNGYSWYSNGKSMFGGERESYLYKDEETKEFATKYLKRAMNGVGKEKWGKMAYAEKTEAIKKEKDYYRTEGRNLYFDTEKGYGIRTDDPEFEKQFFEEYPDADEEDFKDYVKGFNGVGMTNEDDPRPKNADVHNDKGLYQDALNELDDQIAEKEKELENIHLSMTENAEAGYFDIASANMEDIEFVKGQLNELKKKREKLAGSSGNKAPKVTKVDAKKWNSPASDPWKSLYD